MATRLTIYSHFSPVIVKCSAIILGRVQTTDGEGDRDDGMGNQRSKNTFKVRKT